MATLVVAWPYQTGIARGVLAGRKSGDDQQGNHPHSDFSTELPYISAEGSLSVG